MSTIDEVLKDPDFLALSEDEQISFIDEMRQRDFGKAPPTEGFLQKAIKTASSAFTPQLQEEMGDVPRIMLETTGIPSIYNIMRRNPLAGFAEMGAKVSGSRIEDENIFPGFPEPKTEWGKEYNKFIGNVQMAVPSVIGAKRLGVGTVKGIGSLFNVRKSEEKLLDVAYKGSEKVKSRIPNFLKEASDMFGETIDNLPSKMTKENQAEYLMKSAQDLGDVDIIGSSSNKLWKLAVQLSKKGGRVTAREANTLHKQAVKLVGNDNQAKTILRQNFLEKADKTIKGLKELKASHAKIYDIAKSGKRLSESMLTKIGKGRVAPEKVKDLKSGESRLGLDIISGVEKSGKKLSATKRNVSLVKWGSAAGGIGWLLK